MQGTKFDPWPGKIPHAKELSLCTNYWIWALVPMFCNNRHCCSEKPESQQEEPLRPQLEKSLCGNKDPSKLKINKWKLKKKEYFSFFRMWCYFFSLSNMLQAVSCHGSSSGRTSSGGWHQSHKEINITQDELYSDAYEGCWGASLLFHLH